MSHGKRDVVVVAQEVHYYGRVLTNPTFDHVIVLALKDHSWMIMPAVVEFKLA
jgi:hypothetical protein